MTTSQLWEVHKRYIERKYGTLPESELDDFVRGIVRELMGTNNPDPMIERIRRLEERNQPEVTLESCLEACRQKRRQGEQERRLWAEKRIVAQRRRQLRDRE